MDQTVNLYGSLKESIPNLMDPQNCISSSEKHLYSLYSKYVQKIGIWSKEKILLQFVQVIADE